VAYASIASLMNRAVTLALLAFAPMLVGAASASAKTGDYTSCEKTGGAIIVEVSGATCDDARAVATALGGVAAPDVEAVLRAQGWAPLRAIATGYDDSYELFALRGRAALWLREPGEAPDLDGWTAGRELLFSRANLVAGAPPPPDSTICTSSFLIRLGRHLGGLSAAHCADVTKRKTTLRRNAALRRPPQTGLVLGSVRRNLARTSRLDALVLPVPSGPGRPASPVIDRGILGAPWFVVGSERPRLGRAVCFTGRTSGIDRCGKIVRSYPGTGGLPCTTIRADLGDSGSPVYSAPSADGSVRAVGIATLVFSIFQAMCFEPIGPVLHALHATLVTAPAAS
jgi:hypothetical protein